MKKVSFYIVLFISAFAGMLAGCERYDMASIAIHQDSFNDTTRFVQYTAQVTDDGGCARCIEAGYCYSYLDKVPAQTGFYSTVVPVIRDSMMTFTDSTQYLTFTWTRHLPFVESIEAGVTDTTDTMLYFFRSYVTTNAGTFYSPVDTVKVPRIF